MMARPGGSTIPVEAGKAEEVSIDSVRNLLFRGVERTLESVCASAGALSMGKSTIAVVLDNGAMRVWSRVPGTMSMPVQYKYGQLRHHTGGCCS